MQSSFSHFTYSLTKIKNVDNHKFNIRHVKANNIEEEDANVAIINVVFDEIVFVRIKTTRGTEDFIILSV